MVVPQISPSLFKKWERYSSLFGLVSENLSDVVGVRSVMRLLMV